MASACVAPAPPPPPALDVLAEAYVRLTLQLAQHDKSLVDDWRGPEAWRPGARLPVAGLEASIGRLRSALDSTTRADTGTAALRRTYLSRQARALDVAASRLLGAATTFAEEAREGLGIPFAPPDSGSLEASRDALAHELPGTGALVDRYRAYRRTFTVPPRHADRVMRAALAECREASRVLSLPSDEQVELAFVPNLPWDGHARYLGGHRTRVEINADVPLDVSRALRLACHEAYPGHHTQFVWIDDELVTARGWQEFGLTPAFGPHLLIAEGAAEAGADLALPADARQRVYETVLLPLAGLAPGEAARLVRVEDLMAALGSAVPAIAEAYLGNRLTRAATIEQLERAALVPSAEAFVGFLEHQRSRVLAYPEGRRLVLAWTGNAGLPRLRTLFVDRPFALE